MGRDATLFRDPAVELGRAQGSAYLRKRSKMPVCEQCPPKATLAHQPKTTLISVVQIALALYLLPVLLVVLIVVLTGMLIMWMIN